MGRHGKNQTASAVYSYHEKKKDTKTSGYGSKTVRLGKDSLQEFDCCCLSLQPCRNPVITPNGYLFEKEAILECLLHQKKEYARKMKEYEKQSKKEEEELASLAEAEARDRVEKFIGISSSTTSTEKSEKPKLPSFWVPSLTPHHTSTSIKKPDSKTYCPMSNQPLRVKDLIPVKFTPSGEKTSATSKARHICAVTRDVLSNSTPCVVLKPSGDVVMQSCYERLIKDTMICPLTGIKLKESDIIPIIRGGTGFAGAGVALKAKKKGAALMA
ncbi:PREDICTED: nitric oxide synthase-interacting protein-like [Amphimedon queenslandica]|uniref:Nitric oxide synthase-interacting protein zinc-finger domain-containing protein n=1 Tax=Amphimedon queenslandica TaxID=400682 RepID=A0A1X7V5A3_AMPQE|nr:PREDICTED: nitric oxide synthase-interacting protein-like [Amphimedon queenslandica]|eukprot:XP_003385646.1 PREDICTED: nitric oxide synthase-interacting protein-like [Amphimedon queenslandica]